MNHSQRMKIISVIVVVVIVTVSGVTFIALNRSEAIEGGMTTIPATASSVATETPDSIVAGLPTTVSEATPTPMQPSLALPTHTAVPPSPTNTPLPSPEPTPTPERPLGSERPGIQPPDQFVVNYWRMVNNGEYQEAWQALSPGFQEYNHNSQYRNYRASRGDFCSTRAEDTRILSEGNEQARVFSRLIYRAGENCEQMTLDLVYELIRSADGTTWLIDVVRQQ
jgi:type IV secretory pathway VirB10-like protein